MHNSATVGTSVRQCDRWCCRHMTLTMADIHWCFVSNLWSVNHDMFLRTMVWSNMNYCQLFRTFEFWGSRMSTWLTQYVTYWWLLAWIRRGNLLDQSHWAPSYIAPVLWTALQALHCRRWWRMVSDRLQGTPCWVSQRCRSQSWLYSWWQWFHRVEHGSTMHVAPTHYKLFRGENRLLVCDLVFKNQSIQKGTQKYTT